jgi:hypothetical protein
MTNLAFAEIANFAPALVEEYCCPSRPFAWPLYDEDPNFGTLTGADLTAPALLSYPIKGRFLNLMGQDPEQSVEPNPYRVLYRAMESFIDLPAMSTFLALEVDAIEALEADHYDHESAPEDWVAFVRCLEAVQKCPGLTSVAVTKVLHRKRPDLVPVKDSLVAKFYGAGPSYSQLFRSIHGDLLEHYDALRDIAANYTTPLGRPMTELRALDIAVWMYMREQPLEPELGSGARPVPMDSPTLKFPHPPTGA